MVSIEREEYRNLVCSVFVVFFLFNLAACSNLPTAHIILVIIIIIIISIAITI